MSTWIIPCNVKYYDVISAFNCLKKLNWKQSTRIEIGDIVYIYVGRPYSAILYKCGVNKVNLPSPEIDDTVFNKDDEVYGHYGNYMELELMDTYAPSLFTLDKLKEYGLTGNIQGPRKATALIQRLLDSKPN